MASAFRMEMTYWLASSMAASYRAASRDNAFSKASLAIFGCWAAFSTKPLKKYPSGSLALSLSNSFAQTSTVLQSRACVALRPSRLNCCELVVIKSAFWGTILHLVLNESGQVDSNKPGLIWLDFSKMILFELLRSDLLHKFRVGSVKDAPGLTPIVNRLPALLYLSSCQVFFYV